MPELNLNSLKSLTIFKTLYETGSATKTAKALGLTQSGVSRSLGALEENLGLKLFIRDKNRLISTPESAELYNETLGLMFNLDELKHSILALREFGVSRIRIASIPGLAFGFVPKLIAKLLKVNVNLNVYFDIMSTTDVVRSVEAGRFNMGFVTLPVTSNQLQVDPVVNTEAVCLLPKKHPLLKKKFVTLEDLGGEHLIIANQPNIAADKLLELIDRKQLNIAGKTEANIASICALVGNGVGISVLNPITSQDLSNNQIVSRPFVPQIEYSFGLVYGKKWVRSKTIELLRKILGEMLIFYSGWSGHRNITE